MRKDIIIIGAGGLGREVLCVLEELNDKKSIWNIKGFVDDNPELCNVVVNEYPVLGGTDWLCNYPDDLMVVCCIANPSVRSKLINKIKRNIHLEFPNIIAEGVRYSNRVILGEGNIICAGTTLTVDIVIGNFNIINPSCTIGHDVFMNDYITVYPGVNVSGNVQMGKYVEVGTGSQIIQGICICDETILGAGSVVIRNIYEQGTYVGVPVRKI